MFGVDLRGDSCVAEFLTHLLAIACDACPFFMVECVPLLQHNVMLVIFIHTVLYGMTSCPFVVIVVWATSTVLREIAYVYTYRTISSTSTW